MDLHCEAFALAADRAQAIEQLIPGTEEYYAYSCLYYEHLGELDRVDELLGPWIKRYGETRANREIRNRLALLRYDQDPGKSVEYLRHELDLLFNHQRAAVSATTDFPTKLDPQLISRQAVRKLGLEHSHGSDLAGFTGLALEWLADEKLTGDRLRGFLERIHRPDYPNLVDLILRELADKDSGGFGSLTIHNSLLQAQLDALIEARPPLLTDKRFVDAYLAKLQPGPDVDWQNDIGERSAYLARLWGFVEGLTPAFDSLKAHILYHMLDCDRSCGQRDLERFMMYLQLPRDVSYAEPESIKRKRAKGIVFDLTDDYEHVSGHEAVYDDEELVRDYLTHFFLEAEDFAAFEPYIHTPLLREVFATTKILAGVGDMERWYSMLNDPRAYQDLKERVEISFARTNPTCFAASDPVTLDLDVKNVKTLVVKVFEINTLNVFLVEGGEVDTSIDLDGLVASEEQKHEYAEPPQRRVRRSFAFPALERPGVFVIEFIGGGISSRALIRKGRLGFIDRVGAAGHAFTVLDDQGHVLPEATLWLAGREYKPNADAEIVVPFTTDPGVKKMLLCHDSQTTLAAFEHLGESYHLDAGIYVDRESLIQGQTASVCLRPMLLLSGVPTSLKLLEQVRLVIESTDRDGVSATMETRDIALQPDSETVSPFAVPDNLTHICFALRGRVRSMLTSEEVEVSSSRDYALNGIDASSVIEALHLSRTEAGYVVYLYGKSGEAKAHTPLTLSLHHRDLTVSIDLILQTDAAGRLQLGHLRDVSSLSVASGSGATNSWELAGDRCHRPRSIHARVGHAIRVPFMDTAPFGSARTLDAHGHERPPARSLEREDVALFERKGETLVRDHFGALTLSDGYLEVSGLGVGEYDLWLKREGVCVRLRIAAGVDCRGWVVGTRRCLQRRNSTPLQIANVESADGSLQVALGQATADTRVHLFGTRFVPAHSVFAELGRGCVLEPRALASQVPSTHYLSGRDIGDEYRYILERKQATHFAGSMLARPGLLLNPWAMRQSDTLSQQASGGASYARAPMPPLCPAPCSEAVCTSADASMAGFANLDFLVQPTAIAYNLVPDSDGVVRVPLAFFEHANQVRVVAVNAENKVVRDVVLPEVDTAHKDLALQRGLAADAHFAEQKQITVMPAGAPLQIADITTSKVEIYDSLAAVYRLYITLSGNEHLATFGFVLRWPTMSQADKQSSYSKHACHELNLFLAFKDPEFFSEVIQPYIGSKRDKTFVDHYLLEDDLSAYREPWAYGRLNVVERILLAGRVDDDGQSCARHVGDLDDLTPRDIERANRLFRAAIKGSALEAGDRFGLAEARKEAEEEVAEARTSSRGPSRLMTKSLKRERRDREEPEACMKAMAVEMSPCDEELDDLVGFEIADFNAPGGMGGDGGYGDRDLALRSETRAFYQKLEQTQEWAENNYYKRPIEEQNGSLVTANPFWRDFANRGDGPFVSSNMAYATGNFTEMMCALAVLDLPFEAHAPEVSYDGARMSLEGQGCAVAFHQEIKAVELASSHVPILVGQNCLRDDDRYRYEDGERHDKYVTGEFLVHVVYVCQVVVTNPTSSTQKLDLLLQIPSGAVPVRNGFFTRGMHVDLTPYATTTVEYAFYFPAAGTFAHYPVHVSKNDQLIAYAEPRLFTVVRELSDVDTESWAWVSQHGEAQVVLAALAASNVERLDLKLIAWRMHDKTFYASCLELLRSRGVYNDVLWSYSLHHSDVANMREYLRHQDAFLDRCGLFLDSPLVAIDPVARWRYQHLEYAPLVNARAHVLGAERKILNDRFDRQYGHFMRMLCYRPKLTDTDLLAVAAYLLLQDRVEEGLEAYERVDASKVVSTVQYDYLCVVAAFYREQPKRAREIAVRYQDYPVDRWRDLFRNALAQLAEIEGGASEVVDEKDRDQRQAQLAATEAGFDFRVESRRVTIDYQNLTVVDVNIYRMDIELLFSRQPFVQEQSDRFSFIQPNHSEQLTLPAGDDTFAFDLPADYHSANVVVELVGAGQRKSQAYYAHDLAVQVIENYGQVQVRKQGTNQALPRTYVKVYARMHGGAVRFFKDGYTDFRGKFDYASLNTNELASVERFSILILHPEHGAVIREAGVPKR